MPTSSPITPRAAPRRILEDASGRRLRGMRWVGRAVALVFLVWLTLVFLGGVGVGPVARLPFGAILRPSVAPPKLKAPLRPRPTPAADLVPAVAATPTAAARAGRRALPSARRAAHGRSTTAPGHAGATTTVHGKAATAPGHLGTTTITTTATRGKSGKTSAVVHGKSGK
jgi:hypothetical protein